MQNAAAKVRAAPLAKPQDGFNDIVTSRRQQGGGHCSICKLFLAMEEGDFFSPNGNVRPNLAMSYHKASSWSIDPQVKGNALHIIRQQGYQYHQTAVFSIDGERYEAQKIEAQVIQKYLPFYW